MMLMMSGIITKRFRPGVVSMLKPRKKYAAPEIGLFDCGFMGFTSEVLKYIIMNGRLN